MNISRFSLLFSATVISNYVHVIYTVDDWVKSKKMKYLGVPKYLAHGTHKRGSETFRFMVMPRFGSDLQKIFEGCGKKFAKETVLALGLRMVCSAMSQKCPCNNLVHVARI